MGIVWRGTHPPTPHRSHSSWPLHTRRAAGGYGYLFLKTLAAAPPLHTRRAAGGYGYLFLKILAAELIPDAEHLIVLDPDVLVLDDVAALWATFRSFGPHHLVSMAVDQSDRYYYRRPCHLLLAAHCLLPTNHSLLTAHHPLPTADYSCPLPTTHYPLPTARAPPVHLPCTSRAPPVHLPCTFRAGCKIRRIPCIPRDGVGSPTPSASTAA